MYANILKKQLSLAMTTPMSTTTQNWPSHKCQATILDYDLDQLDYPPLATNNASSSTSNASNSIATIPSVTMNPGYATELQSLKHKISQLTMLITTAMEQIKQALTSLPMIPPTESNAMDTDVESNLSSATQMATNNPPPYQLDLPVIIQELKNNIATITNKMPAMLQQHLPPNTTNKSSLLTWIQLQTSVGLLH